MVKKRFDGWFAISIIMLLLFIAVLIYPMVGIIKQSVIMPDGSVSWEQFQKFFGQSYYSKTIVNSFKITFFVTALTLVIGIPFAYFYAFYRLKGAKILFVVSILCCMSAPFLGAYSWVMLLGRAGIITKFFKSAFGIKLPSIYGFGGIALSQTLKFFPLQRKKTIQTRPFCFVSMPRRWRRWNVGLPMSFAPSMGSCNGLSRRL